LFIFRSSKKPFGGGKHPPLCAGSPPGAFKEGNAALANGVLELRTIHEPGFLPAPPDPDCDCIHGEISTPLLVSTTQMQHGFYEIRAKMASAALLSSFFLQGDGGEINIFDVSPSGGAGSTFTNGYHCFNSAGTGDDTEHTSMSITGFDPQDGFHTYGIERSASGVTFYIDGMVARHLQNLQVQTEGCLDMKMSVVFSMETLASIGAPANVGTFTTEVDYFRFWSVGAAGCDGDDPVLATFGPRAEGMRYLTYESVLEKVRQVTLEECEEECAEETECWMYSWKLQDGVCLMFPTGSTTVAADGFTTAFKLTAGCQGAVNAACNVNDVAFEPLQSDTRYGSYADRIGVFKPVAISACELECASTPQCGMYTYKTAASACLLFPATSKTTISMSGFELAVRTPDSCMDAATYAAATTTAAIVMPMCANLGGSMFPTEQAQTRIKNTKKRLGRQKGTLSDCFEYCAQTDACMQLSYAASTSVCMIFAPGFPTVSKAIYSTYNKECSQCVDGIKFGLSATNTRFVYSSLPDALITMYDLTPFECLAWCAANSGCGMVTHADARQTCTAFGPGVSTKSVAGHTTTVKQAGTCTEVSTSVATVPLYPVCRYDAAISGQFSMFSTAIGELKQSGKQMCLGACLAHAECTHVAYKKTSGKCLLFPASSPVDQGTDNTIETYMVSSWLVTPAPECEPLSAGMSAGIARSKDVVLVQNANTVPIITGTGTYFETRLAVLREEKANRQKRKQRENRIVTAQMWGLVASAAVVVVLVAVWANGYGRTRNREKLGYYITPGAMEEVDEPDNKRSPRSKPKHLDEQGCIESSPLLLGPHPISRQLPKNVKIMQATNKIDQAKHIF
jgi:hypothetical protein